MFNATLVTNVRVHGDGVGGLDCECGFLVPYWSPLDGPPGTWRRPRWPRRLSRLWPESPPSWFCRPATTVPSLPLRGVGIALGVGGLLGGYLGARAQPHLPDMLIRRVLGVLVIAIGARYAYLAARSQKRCRDSKTARPQSLRTGPADHVSATTTNTCREVVMLPSVSGACRGEGLNSQSRGWGTKANPSSTDRLTPSVGDIYKVGSPFERSHRHARGQ